MSGKKVFTHTLTKDGICISINDLEGYPSKSKLQSKKIYNIFNKILYIKQFLIKYYTLNNFIV